MSAPANGSHYQAWIINEQSEHVISLGALTGSGPVYSLTYNGDGAAGRPGTNLLGIGDKAEITVERGDAQAPVGTVVLVGALPPHAAEHIDHLLVSYPDTPSKIGLLVGVLAQTQIANAQAAVLQNAQASHNMAAVQCGAQSIVDVIEGARGANYHPLPAACAAQNIPMVGDGYGLLAPAGAAAAADSTEGLGYLEDATDHASFAASADDATPGIRTHAGHVEVALANIKGWITTADQDALKLLKTPADGATAADLATQCDHAYHGVARSTDQQIQPVPGQAGAITAYDHGQFMATIALIAGH